MTDTLTVQRQALASIGAGTAAFRNTFKRDPFSATDLSFVDGYACALRNTGQVTPVPAVRRKFQDLPLGTRFRYPGKEQVYVKLEGFGVGLIAKWNGPEGEEVSQQIFSFADAPLEASTMEVEIVG